MKHIMLTILVMLPTQAVAGQMRADIQHDTPPGQATMKVYDGDKLLFQAASQGLSCISESKFSSNGKWLLNIANGCGYVQLWDVKKGERLRTFLGVSFAVDAIFTPDGKRFLLNFPVSNGYSSYWSLQPLREISLLRNDKEDVYYYDSSVGFGKDNKRMVFTDGYSPASVWKVSDGSYIKKMPRILYKAGETNGGGCVSCSTGSGVGALGARLSPDGKRVLVLYRNRRLAEYDVATAKLIKGRGKFHYDDAYTQLDQFAQTGH